MFKIASDALNQVKMMSMETYFLGLTPDKKEDLLKWAAGVHRGTINPNYNKGPFQTPQELQMREQFLNMSPAEKDKLINMSVDNKAKADQMRQGNRPR